MFPQRPSVLHDQESKVQQRTVSSRPSPAPGPSAGSTGSANPDSPYAPAGRSSVLCSQTLSIRTFPENKEENVATD